MGLPQKATESLRMHETMEMTPSGLQENGLSQVLTMVLEELGLYYHQDVNGIGVLYNLLQAPWLQSLLKVHSCLQQYIQQRPQPVLPKACILSNEVVGVLRETTSSADLRELKRLLQGPHFKALLSAHDMVAQADFEPVLPPLPDNIPDNEEAMRIVCLVKNKQPLGATIKRHEITGDIIVARVIHGGLADRSGLLYAGDKLVEVNGVLVDGLEPEQVIQILARSEGTIVFKLSPVNDRYISSHTMLYVRAMADYWPQQDPAIPCADAGLPFQRGEILQIVDQNDSLWWQARKASDLGRCAGLIPSNHLLKRKQREFWWSQPFMSHSCIKASQLSTIGEEEDMKIEEKFVEADEETFESEELKGGNVICKFFCSVHRNSNHLVQDIYISMPQDLATIWMQPQRHNYRLEYFGQEKEDEFRDKDGNIIAGFRRSMRLCRRKTLINHMSCYSRCPSNCYHTVAAPYEEVVRYQRRPCDRHRLIVLLGPSGVGVNEMRKQLIDLNPSMFKSPVPHTTRQKKTYEENGREYFFVSKEAFESMVYSHGFLEYGEYNGHMYGTSVEAVKAVLDAGMICIIDLEPQCITGVRTHELKPYIIFIKPPSRNCMRYTRKNASIFTDYYVNMKFKEEDFQEIEESAKKMEVQFGQFFDQVVVNDNLESATVQLMSILRCAQDEPQWIPASWICLDS
ncbi:MAGUK p55 subfamily member 4 [Xenopus tropicalis]|uniref:MAGUK p55 subfamily member 4 n=1 Tax=Xenopus tropicalis TaxID=8364 RepID=A0A8J1IYZ6_XENTR|nr:MAGUK p55 subfamily member 4 [Xenopus tropicalis]